jgi:hypothetical protein
MSLMQHEEGALTRTEYGEEQGIGRTSREPRIRLGQIVLAEPWAICSERVGHAVLIDGEALVVPRRNAYNSVERIDSCGFDLVLQTVNA